jgi:hypothetical protein
MKTFLTVLFLSASSGSLFSMSLIELSQNYLSAVRYDEKLEPYLTALAASSEQKLLDQLNTDTKKKIFWINIYNATVQMALKEDTSQYKKRMAFYGKKRLEVAGKVLSLNDIEHGLLRKSQWIYGLGRVRKWFPGQFERRHRVESLDIRIHFALNCGAKSCPPIFFYREDQFEAQLNQATKGFLSETSFVDGKTLILSKLFFYYSGDFGSKRNKIKLVQEFTDLNLEGVKKISYADYDWTMQLNMYRQ